MISKEVRDAVIASMQSGYDTTPEIDDKFNQLDEYAASFNEQLHIAETEYPDLEDGRPHPVAFEVAKEFMGKIIDRAEELGLNDGDLMRYFGRMALIS